ncbi:MAG: AAA family ATPase, partial [Nocardioidaceae bacterium]
MSDGVTLKGRERELASLQRVLDVNGPRVAFVYGVAGIGKSALLNAFANGLRELGTHVWRIDCAAIDPTESSFRAALDAAGWQPGSAGVVLVDTYEVFRIADPWLRHELVPSLSADLRFVLAGRDAPMLEWSTERGRVGGLEILPLVGLADEAAKAFLADANVAEDHADMICRIARGHPLSLRLAAEADVAHVPIDDVGPRVVAALATAFRAGLDDEGRQLLDAASVPRRVTRGVLEAMTSHDADDAIERLRALSFIDETSEGLRLHDAVQAAVSARLRALEPERFRELRSAAWHHLQNETRRAGATDLRRFTADLLFLIDNPFVREAMFPATAHAFSVERSREEDADALRALWHEFETPEGASVLDAWLRLRPAAVRSVRDRTGAVIGCSIVAEWRD